MKKIIFYAASTLLFGALFSLSSCVDEPFYERYYLPENKNICLPASPTQAYQSYEYVIKNEDVVAGLAAVGVDDLSLITSAKILDLKAELTTGSDFSEVASIEAYMRPVSGSGLGEQIAYSVDLASATTVAVLNCNGVDMNQVISEDMLLTVKILNIGAGNVNDVCVKLKEGVVEVKVTPK